MLEREENHLVPVLGADLHNGPCVAEGMGMLDAAEEEGSGVCGNSLKSAEMETWIAG